MLKNLVCTGFGHITIIDLDTVDTSNLNRQFLFQKKHVKRSKAIVARETATAFNPNVTITAIHSSIMDPKFDQAYFKSFDLVLNALDNLGARRHVNKMCVMTNVPLIESGTAGYSGQVQPIRSGQIECYDCQPKPLPKTYPVCTIRSTPSSPIHCIVWAKDYLFPQLFGPEDENEGADLDEAIQNGESAQEVENLRAEAKRMKEIRNRLDSPEMSRIVFKKIYEEDIERLLKMDDMWKHRSAPTPLNYDELASQQNPTKPEQKDSHVNGLKDQQNLSLQECFQLFCSSLLALGKRIEADPSHEPLRWDKDDDDALNFVMAASNLRANVFGIAQKTRFDVKQVAGNIIPAIATTNSAVSALIVFQAINILSRSRETDSPSQNVAQEGHEHSSVPLPSITACRPWYSKSAERIILAANVDPPNPHCQVCQVVYSNIHVSQDCTLNEFISQVLKGKLYDDDDDDDDESITIQEGDRLLYDPDFTDNKTKTFGELNLVGGPVEKVLRITDEAERYVPLLLTVSKSPMAAGVKLLLEGIPDRLPHRPPPEPTLDRTEPELNDGSDIEQVTSNNTLNSAKRSRLVLGDTDDSKVADEIVLIDGFDSDTKLPPTKKIRLSDPGPPNNPDKILDKRLDVEL